MLPWLLDLLQLSFLWRLMAPEQDTWLTILSPLGGVYGVWVGWGFPAPTRRLAMGIGAGLGTLVAFALGWLMGSLPAWGWATLLGGPWSPWRGYAAGGARGRGSTRRGPSSRSWRWPDSRPGCPLQPFRSGHCCRV